MEHLGFLLDVLAIAFVIEKVIFSSNDKTLGSNDLTKDKGDRFFLLRIRSTSRIRSFQTTGTCLS